MNPNHVLLKLLWGQGLATFAGQMMFTAIPLIAALTLEVTPAQMGLLVTVETLPWLLVTLFAGALIDNGSPRRVALWSNLARGLLLLSIPAAYLLGALSYGWLLAVALLYGVCYVFFDLALMSLVPGVVPKERLVGTNGQIESSRQVAAIAGPGLGGALVQLAGAPLTLLLGGLSFWVSALALGSLGGGDGDRLRSKKFNWADIREGWRAVFGSPLLRPLVLASGNYNLHMGILAGVSILFYTRELGVSPAGVGVILGVQSAGGLVGSLVASRVTRRFGPGGTVVRMLALAALSSFAAPLVFGPPALATALIAAAGFLGAVAIVTSNVNMVSLRQSSAPPELLGRVNATARFVGFGVGSLGGVLGGLLAEAVGLRAAMFAAACIGMTAFLWPLFSPVGGLRSLPGQPDQAR